MRIKIDKKVLKDIARVRRKLNKASRDIKSDTPGKVQEAGFLGFNYAYNLAPEFSGALKRAMRLETLYNQATIISSHPAGDAIPTHKFFDLGIYPNPRVASSLGYMKKTANFLRRQFTERLGIMVHHNIEKVKKR